MAPAIAAQMTPQPAVRRFPRAADLKRIARLVSAEILGIGGRTDPWQVQPVGIPAGADGQIVVPLAAGVPCNGRDEQIEGIVVERDELAPDGCGEPGRPRAMLRIPAFIFTADIIMPIPSCSSRPTRARSFCWPSIK